MFQTWICDGEILFYCTIFHEEENKDTHEYEVEEKVLNIECSDDWPQDKADTEGAVNIIFLNLLKMT